MERLVVVVFESEEKAYEAQRALTQLDADGMITVNAHAVIAKGQDGTVKLKEPADLAPLGLVSGGLLGSLIGVLGGPVGWAVGAVTGGFLGGLMDLADAGVGADFLEDVRNTLRPGKTAVVAEVSERWITPVDVVMEKLGGVVFRTTREELDARRNEQAIGARKAEIAQLEAERAQAGADREAKLQAKIDERRTKLQESLDLAKEKSEAVARERDAKVKALQEKAAKAKADMKAEYEERITTLRSAYDKRVNKLKELVG